METTSRRRKKKTYPIVDNSPVGKSKRSGKKSSLTNRMSMAGKSMSKSSGKSK